MSAKSKLINYIS